MSGFDAQIAGFAAQAVEHLRDHPDGPLDYTEASLARVEDALTDAADHRREMSDAQILAIVQHFGCYILEVGRRAIGGVYRWHEEREQPVLVVGEPDFHVALLTWSKVRGRLEGDEADNIPFFYQGFAERAGTAEPGTMALYE